MKNRLQTLWNEVAPDSGPCPQPDVKKVRRRVDKALDGRPRTVYPHRVLRLALVAATAVLLLTGTALAGGELIPPEFNVLSTQFGWGENPETAIAMMTITPMSVEDGNYTMTVTSSLADGNRLYFTLIIQPKNDEARERLQNTHSQYGDLLSFRISGSNSYGFGGEVDAETGALLIGVSATWKTGKSASARLNLMDEGIWLEFPVKPVRSITLKLNAEGQGMGMSDHASGGPVEVKTITLSPLTCALDFTTPADEAGIPVIYFLFQDDSIRTMNQMMHPHYSGHGEGSGLFESGYDYHYKLNWQFGAVQDLSQLEAVIFEGMAYPLGDGEPYEVDMSAFIRPFNIPAGEKLDGLNVSIPFFALCEGLGADYTWDEEAGVATGTFRGVSITFTLGSKAVQCEAIPEGWNASETNAAPVYQDGELWVNDDGYGLFSIAWNVELTAAIEDWEHRQVSEDHSVTFTDWVVIP